MSNEWCFRARFCTCKVILGWGQLGLMNWILWRIMSQVQDRSLDLLTSSPALYHCTTDVPIPGLMRWILVWTMPLVRDQSVNWLICGSTCYCFATSIIISSIAVCQNSYQRDDMVRKATKTRVIRDNRSGTYTGWQCVTNQAESKLQFIM